MNKFDYETFYEKENLEEMIISDKLSMKSLYEKLAKENYSPKEDDIEIINRRNGTFDIVNNKNIRFLRIFESPLQITFKKKTINIINILHLEQIFNKYKIINPIIICNYCKSECKYSTFNFNNHPNHDISIKDSIIFKTISSSKFDDYFNKEKNENNIFGKEFKNPEEFEKNFQYYFKDYKIYKDRPFKLFTDKLREENISLFEFNILSNGRFIQFFGQSGMGKSISIIALSKYMIVHEYKGTLYLNLKCLKKMLDKNDYLNFKQIIIDEIPYLFYQNYDAYITCIKLVQDYVINDKNENDIWKLVSKIMEFIYDNSLLNKSPRKYTMIFDQYNEKMDKSGCLFQLEYEYISNKDQKNKIFSIISLSSMNNKDIQNYKIMNIQKEFKANELNLELSQKVLVELTDIYDKNEFKFEDDSDDEYFELLGRNIKYYNILSYYISLKKDIELFINKLKEQIKDSIKSFYGCEQDRSNIIKLLYFSTTTRYNLDKFLEVAEYIPFKYFTPIIEKDKYGKKSIQINFSFLLIEEIVNELLGTILNHELNIYNILLENNMIDGGARGQLFEKLVTYELNPDNPNRKIFFKDINIYDVKKVKKFIPREKEKIRKIKKKTKLETNKTYLFVQDIINGKDLDILIVNVGKNNKTEIVGIQITIHREDSKIFTIGYLDECYKKLKENLSNMFQLDINLFDMYFTYIFDKSYKTTNKTKFNQMIKKCNENSMPFMVFDPVQKLLCNNIEQTVNNLVDFIICPHEPVKSITKFGAYGSMVDRLTITFGRKKVREPSYYIYDKEKDDIINILKKETIFGNKIKDIKYLNIVNKSMIDKEVKNKLYVKRLFNEKLIIAYFSKFENLMIHKFVGNNDEIECEKYLDNQEYINNFDEYEIISE